LKKTLRIYEFLWEKPKHRVATPLKEVNLSRRGGSE